VSDRPEPGDDRKPGPPSEERVRLELVLFADLVLRLEKENRLAEALPFVLRRLGDLRRLLFDYEVRATERLLPIEDPNEREARRLVREIEERKREMMEEWGEGWTPDGEEEPGP
jgi:hypothetical protein